jgi:hypothetical protein
VQRVPKRTEVTITDEDLSRWEALCAAATPGLVAGEPMSDQPGTFVGGWVKVGNDATCIVAERREDAAFIAAARTAVPDLCAGYREKASMVAALEDSVIVYEQGWVKAEAERDAAREALDTLMQANLAMAAERDALRAEVRRLRRPRETVAEFTVTAQERYEQAAKERDAARVEVSELRACLADAVGKIEAMGRVVDAAKLLLQATRDGADLRGSVLRLASAIALTEVKP